MLTLPLVIIIWPFQCKLSHLMFAKQLLVNEKCHWIDSDGTMEVHWVVIQVSMSGIHVKLYIHKLCGRTEVFWFLSQSQLAGGLEPWRWAAVQHGGRGLYILGQISCEDDISRFFDSFLSFQCSQLNIIPYQHFSSLWFAWTEFQMGGTELCGTKWNQQLGFLGQQQQNVQGQPNWALWIYAYTHVQVQYI